MSESTTQSRCTDWEGDAALKAGLLTSMPGTGKQEVAIHAFAEVVRLSVAAELGSLRARVAELEQDGAAIGIELAAKYVDKLHDDFCQDHMTIDPDTNTAEFGRGPRGAAAEEYSNELAEIAGGIRALAAAKLA